MLGYGQIWTAEKSIGIRLYILAFMFKMYAKIKWPLSRIDDVKPLVKLFYFPLNENHG